MMRNLGRVIRHNYLTFNVAFDIPMESFLNYITYVLVFQNLVTLLESSFTEGTEKMAPVES